MSPASLFLSYRRTDAPTVARLCARLTARFGGVRLFLDVQDIAPGQLWETLLTEVLAVCQVVLVVMGPRWLETLEQRAATRTPDYVHLELAAALARPILVIPVLLEGAVMPIPAQLPADLAALSGRQAFAIRDAFDRDAFDDDVLRLSDTIAAALRV